MLIRPSVYFRDIIENVVGSRRRLQSNCVPAGAYWWNVENCLSLSLRMMVIIATFLLSPIVLSACTHATIVLSLRSLTHFVGGFSFVSCPAVLALTNCGKNLSVIVQSEGGHTFAGTPLHTRSRMRTTYSAKS